MKRFSPPPASLPGVLTRYLVLTVALGALAALGWWFGLTIVMNTGLVLPANAAEQASLAALETLEGRTAATFADAAAGFDPLCRYVLFAGPDSDTVLATNLTGRELEGALRCWHSEPSGRVFYPLFSRRGRLADGSVCLLVYTFSMPYANRALQGVLPDFQLLGLGVLAGLEVLVVALTTRRTARRLRRESERLQAAADRIRAGDLSGPPFPRGRIRELDAALQAMQTLRRHLADSLQAQWAADQQRAEQITALTHDLKTPLTVISGHAELLAEEDLPPAARESAEAIRRGADRAGQYLADLRAAAAPGAGQEPAAPVEAAGFAAGRAGVGRALCAAAGLTFEMETDLPAGLRFPAQEGRLARAVDNLLDNAVRHTPAGGTVRLTAALQDGALVFRVRDSGPGFTPEALRKAGRLLYTGDPARHGPHQGLGLYLARRVAEAHGGGLELRNAGGGGAEATLRVSLEGGETA